jgi:hypothetical protein
VDCCSAPGVLVTRWLGNRGLLSCRPVPAHTRAPPTGCWITFEVAMKTPGEIEAAVCAGLTRFQQEYVARGPKDVQAHLLGDPEAGRIPRRS